MAPGFAAIAVPLLLAMAGAGPAPAMADAADGEIDDAVKRAFGAGDYQRELPLPKASDSEGEGARNDPMANPDWWRTEGDSQAPDLHRPGTREQQSDGFTFDIPPALREVLRVLMWIVFVAGGALVAYYLLNEARLFSRWKKGGWRPEDEGGDTATGAPGQGAATFADYESLAARGEFGEAVHVLLLRSIMLIRDRGVALSTSLTSREILRKAPLQETEKDAFKTLVGVAELTHFGGRGATESDFLHCRDLFHRIAQGSAGGNR